MSVARGVICHLIVLARLGSSLGAVSSSLSPALVLLLSPLRFAIEALPSPCLSLMSVLFPQPGVSSWGCSCLGGCPGAILLCNYPSLLPFLLILFSSSIWEQSPSLQQALGDFPLKTMLGFLSLLLVLLSLSLANPGIIDRIDTHIYHLEER